MSSPTDSTASDAFRTYGVELRMSPACRECLSEDNIGISQGLLHIKPVYDLLEIKAIFDLPHKSIDLSSRGFHFIFPMVLFEIHPDPSTVEESIQTSFQSRSKMRHKDCTVTERLQQKSSDETGSDETVPSEPLKDIFRFTTLPSEIRSMIYLYVLESHPSHFGTMTLSIPQLSKDINVPYTNIAYSCESKKLQLICKQVTKEILLLIQYRPQQLIFRDLGEGNVMSALEMVEKQPNLQSSVHLLELEYTIPIPEFGPLKGRCYFLPNEVKDAFCSIARRCKNLESIKLSFIIQQEHGSAKKLNVEIFCHDKEKNSYLQISNRWVKMASWEKTLRMYLRDIERGKSEEQNKAVWRYQCNCTFISEIKLDTTPVEWFCEIQEDFQIESKSDSDSEDGDEEEVPEKVTGPEPIQNQESESESNSDSDSDSDSADGDEDEAEPIQDQESESESDSDSEDENEGVTMLRRSQRLIDRQESGTARVWDADMGWWTIRLAAQKLCERERK